MATFTREQLLVPLIEQPAGVVDEDVGGAEDAWTFTTKRTAGFASTPTS